MKGQSALPILTTYGWAIGIIVIVVAAMFALGILNPSTYTSDSCVGFGKLPYQEHKVDTDGILTLVLKNGVGRSISITTMTVTPQGGTEQTVFTSNTTVAPLADITLVAETGATGWTGTAGEAYQGTVSVLYDTASITANRESGSCTGALE